MNNRKDLTGQRFGKLVVLQDVGRRGGYVQWKCNCDCGNQSTVRSAHLLSGQTRSCGCLLSPRKSNFPSAFGVAIREYQFSAQKRGYTWLLSDEQAFSLFMAPCYYCGNEPANIKRLTGSKRVFICNGIDRKNPIEGYSIENCVTCCKRCNLAKGAMAYNDFIDWIRTVYERVASK